jgi:AGZA family xanthine/uracil permease-like MFS transporter
LIPACIQASTAVGIGLITAFAGAIDLKLVVRGEYTVVTMGTATKDVYFALIAAVVIAMALNYHFKFSFVLGLMVGTLLSWSFDMDFPQAIVSYPEFDRGDVNMDFNNPKIIYLVCNLLFLYILLLNGLARGLADLAQLTQADGSILRGNWIFVICGIGTILSGYLSGPPLLISPESAAGIKAGSKTGFSTLICGLMYMLSIFLSPIFSTVPPAGTSPLMVFVGMLLFQNISRIDWHDHISCVPAFFVLLLIPFTYSIIGGGKLFLTVRILSLTM